MSTDPALSEAQRPLWGLSGTGGTVWIFGDSCGFLRDACAHVDTPGCFDVPFSVDALNVVAAYTRGASGLDMQQASALRLPRHVLHTYISRPRVHRDATARTSKLLRLSDSAWSIASMR